MKEERLRIFMSMTNSFKNTEFRRLLPSPWDSLVTQIVQSPPAMQETWVRSLGWEDPWRREWQPAPVYLPGEFQIQRNLAGYSPWGRKESDMTEQLTLSLSPLLWSLSRKQCINQDSFPNNCASGWGLGFRKNLAEFIPLRGTSID